MSLKAPLVPTCTPSALDGHPLGLLPNTALPFLGASLCYLTLFLLGREPQNTSTPFYNLKAFHYCTSSCSVSSKVFIHRPFLSGSQTDPFPGNPGFPLYILPASLFFFLWLRQAESTQVTNPEPCRSHTHTPPLSQVLPPASAVLSLLLPATWTSLPACLWSHTKSALIQHLHSSHVCTSRHPRHTYKGFGSEARRAQLPGYLAGSTGSP